jgi:hypothetical protein
MINSLSKMSGKENYGDGQARERVVLVDVGSML